MPAAVFDNYGFTYALGGKPALTGINLKIERGEILTLCGASGSGKSTLLRCLKKAANPAGKHSGSLTAIDDKDIAIVFQNPETQLVMTTVIDDLVFQMENRRVPEKQMKKRVSETAAFFGIEPWLHKRVDELSGGQKQMTALCAALMCEPRLLLLDEPIAQLDPLAGAALLETVRNLNRELGVTVVMAEHRLDECAAVSDRIAFLQDGKLVYAGEVREALRYLHSGGFADYVPPLPKASLTIDGGCVLTPREFSERYPTAPKKINDSEGKAAQPSAGLRQRRKSESSGFQSRKNAKNFLVNITDLSAGYPSDKLPVLRRLDFTAARGETVCLLGGNGSGKSTL
jgi:energy-coupling factor transport system ATP-binding protein